MGGIGSFFSNLFGGNNNDASGYTENENADATQQANAQAAGDNALANGQRQYAGFANQGNAELQTANQLGAQAQGAYGQAAQGYGATQGALGQQGNALALDQQAAMGNAPSAAALQMQAGTDAAAKQQMALAAGGGGGLSGALAQYHAQQAGAGLQQQNVQATGQERAQEMAAARQQYDQASGALTQNQLAQQGMSIGQAQGLGSLAQGEQGIGQASQGLGLNAQGQAYGQVNADNSLGLQYGQLGQGIAASANAQNAQNATTLGGQAIGAIGSLAAGAATASDERVKTEIHDLDETQSPLDADKRPESAGRRLPKDMTLEEALAADGIGGDPNSDPSQVDRAGMIQRARDVRAGLAAQAPGELAGAKDVNRRLDAMDAGIDPDDASPWGALAAPQATGGYGEQGAFNQGPNSEYAEAFGTSGADHQGGYVSAADMAAAAQQGIGPAAATAGTPSPGSSAMAGLQKYFQGMARPQQGPQNYVYKSPLLSSDGRGKEGVAPSKMGDFLSKLDPVSYRYKDPAMDPSGDNSRTRVGIIAQDAAKSDVGRSMLEHTPQGLAINMKAGLSVALAALADHEARIRKAEDDGSGTVSEGTKRSGRG